MKKGGAERWSSFPEVTGQLQTSRPQTGLHSGNEAEEVPRQFLCLNLKNWNFLSRIFLHL